MKYNREKYHKRNETSKAVKEIMKILIEFKGFLWAPLLFSFLLELMQMGNRLFITEILKRIEVSDWIVVGVLIALKPAYDFVLRRIDVMVVLTTIRNIGYDLYRAYERKTVEHTATLGHTFFAGVQISKIISRINGIVNVVDVIEEGFWNMVSNIFQILISIVVLVFTLPAVAPIVLLTFFLFIRFQTLMLREQEPVKKRRKDREEERDESTMRIVSTALTLMNNNAMQRMLARHDKEFSNLRRIGLLELMIVISGRGLMRDVVIHLGRLSVLAVAVLSLQQGLIDLPTMVLVYTVSETMFIGFWGVVRFLHNFTYQTPKIIKTSELLALDASIQEPEIGKQIAPGPLQVEFNNVSFCYPKIHLGDDKAPAGGEVGLSQVSHLNLIIPRGKKVGLVGPTGSGKTTTTLFLTKLQLATQGNILINGVDILDIHGNDLRQRTAIVPQGGDIDIYNDTLLFNITLGDQRFTEQDVLEALEAAMLLETVAGWSKGIMELIGERGRTLSGGQRQRVAIARAIIRKPDLIILDEATSALDSQTELLIQRSLDNLLEGRTAVIIAHRLSTLRNVDKIVVMDKGRIVEEGPWEELVNNNGLFADLVRTQNLQ